MKSNEFESQRALFYTKTKIPISQNSEIIPNSFKLTSILDKNDDQQNIKTKQKLFHIEKIEFTFSPPSPYPHPFTTTNHNQKKKKKKKPPPLLPPANPPPTAHHKPHPSKTKSQTHQINQPTPISQSHPNQLIPMTIKPLMATETHL